jgi:UDP-N-acetylglucosamine 4,6-dehydratase
MKDTYVITGVTGFLGRNLTRYILERTTDARIIGVSRRWADQERFSKQLNDPRVTMLTGDIRDRVFLEGLTRIIPAKSVFFHTAAYKHVPMANVNVHECYTVNIDGTRNMLWLADNVGADNFIFISTDKSVAPINVYGQSKAIAEQLVFNRVGSSVVCRFGNVWGSTGSVVQYWAEMTRVRGSVFKVTNPDMTRYWYPLSKAVQYVFDSRYLDDGVVIPLLKSSTIRDLAESAVRLTDNGRVEYIGVRDGEKIHEAMTTKNELAQRHIDTYFVSDGIVVLRSNEEHVIAATSFDADSILGSDLAPRYTVEELMEMIDYYEKNELGSL